MDARTAEEAEKGPGGGGAVLGEAQESGVIDVFLSCSHLPSSAFL